MPSSKVGLASSPPNSPRPGPTAEDLDRILSLIRRDSDLLVGNLLGELKDVVDVDELEARAVEGAGGGTEFQRAAAKEVFRRRREELEAEMTKKKMKIIFGAITTTTMTTMMVMMIAGRRKTNLRGNCQTCCTVLDRQWLPCT